MIKNQIIYIVENINIQFFYLKKTKIINYYLKMKKKTNVVADYFKKILL